MEFYHLPFACREIPVPMHGTTPAVTHLMAKPLPKYPSPPGRDTSTAELPNLGPTNVLRFDSAQGDPMGGYKAAATMRLCPKSCSHSRTKCAE